MNENPAKMCDLEKVEEKAKDAHAKGAQLDDEVKKLRERCFLLEKSLDDHLPLLQTAMEETLKKVNEKCADVENRRKSQDDKFEQLYQEMIVKANETQIHLKKGLADAMCSMGDLEAAVLDMLGRMKLELEKDEVDLLRSQLKKMKEKLSDLEL